MSGEEQNTDITVIVENGEGKIDSFDTHKPTEAIRGCMIE